MMRYIAERLAYNRRNSPKLNPVLFDEDMQLKSEIKEKVLKIVDAFLEYTQTDIRILDIRLVGSNAAYNYHPESDLDIHIVTDLSEISDPETIARLYFDSVKKNFKDSYDITIKGIDVEMYVEDINTSANSNGVYSVSQDKWIKEPTPEADPTDEEFSEAEEIEEEIIRAIKSTKSVEDLQAIVDKLYLMRKDSLIAHGETGAGNLAFKSLRNKGILDDIKDTIKQATSRELSLESKKVNEVKSTGKLTLSDLESYPYKFSRLWRGAPNSTYMDDFLALAEEHNCIWLRNDSYRMNFFACKSKLDYESLKAALKEDKILSSFIYLGPLDNIDWDDITSKVSSIYVDRYEGGYSVKFPRR